MVFKKKYSELGGIKTSQAQLAEDFGEFPPRPLRSDGLPFEFRVTSGGQLKFFINLMKLLFSCVFLGKKYDFYGVDKEILLIIDNLLGFANDCKIKISDFKKEFLASPLYAKGVFVILSPVVLLFVILAFFYSLVFLMIKNSRKLFSFQDCYGSFNSLDAFLSCKTPELNISKVGLKLDIEDIKAVISHEHIHYLQHLHGIREHDYLCKRKINNGYLLFSEAEVFDGRMSGYFFAEHEVEARLHELVVNYYRRYRCLPLNICEMVSLVFKSAPVFASEVPGSQSDKILKWRGMIKKNLPGCRSLVIGSDIMMMCQSIKSEKEGVRYIYEVLPIFYSRLLRYYGDDDASRQFSEQIMRPNFYDQLYGGTAA